jgi:hypothetical protein
MSKQLLLETLQWLDTLDYQIDDTEEVELERQLPFLQEPKSPLVTNRIDSWTSPLRSLASPARNGKVSISTNTTPYKFPLQDDLSSVTSFASSTFIHSPKRSSNRLVSFLDVPISGMDYESDTDEELSASSSLKHFFKKWKQWKIKEKEGNLTNKSSFLNSLSEGMLLTRIPAWRSYLLTLKGLNRWKKYAEKRKNEKAFLSSFHPFSLSHRYKVRCSFVFWKVWQKHHQNLRGHYFRYWIKRRIFFLPLFQVRNLSSYPPLFFLLVFLVR